MPIGDVGGLNSISVTFFSMQCGQRRGDLKIINIDSSFLMSNYCNIGIFVAVDLLRILQKVFVV